MRSLICAFVVCIWLEQVFPWPGSYNDIKIMYIFFQFLIIWSLIAIATDYMREKSFACRWSGGFSSKSPVSASPTWLARSEIILKGHRIHLIEIFCHCYENENSYWQPLHYQYAAVDNHMSCDMTKQLLTTIALPVCCCRQPYELRHDKTSKVTVRPAKTPISLGIRQAWSESSLSA